MIESVQCVCFGRLCQWLVIITRISTREQKLCDTQCQGLDTFLATLDTNIHLFVAFVVYGQVS